MLNKLTRTTGILAIACFLATTAMAQHSDNETDQSLVSIANQPAPTCLGLSQAMSLAAENDPARQTSEALQRQARADIIEAKSLYRPQISTFARTGLGDVGLIDSAIQNQVGISASQRIIDFGDARLARKAATHNLNAARSDTDQIEIESATGIGVIMLDLMEASEAIAFTENRRTYFQQQLEAIESVLAAGGATVSERAEVAAQLANAQAFFLDLKFRKERAETRFLIGTESQTPICDPASVEAEFRVLNSQFTSVEALIEQAISNTPELQALRHRVQNLEAVRKREARARLPVISVVGSLAYSSVGSAGNFELQERVGLDVSVPIFTGNALNARSQRAGARRAEASGRVADLRRQLEEDVRVSYQRTLSLQAQLLTRQDFEDRSRELFEFATIEYEAGTRTLPELIDVRLEYEQAGLQRIAAKYGYLREQLALAALTASLS